MFNNVIDFVSKARGRRAPVAENDNEAPKNPGRVNSEELREIFADIFEDAGLTKFATSR